MRKSSSTSLSQWAKNERGNAYGRWTVIEFAKRDNRGVHWLCRCVCGNMKTVWGADLRNGKSTSCGCSRQRAYGMNESKEYATWEAIKQRCYNKNHDAYKHYGGRGIKMCDRWYESFCNFFDDMGKRPFPKATIDRIDNDGNYEPSNCRWASQLEQGQNTSKVRLVTYNGETMSLRAWARKLGISHRTLSERIRKGWSEDRVFSPKQHR